MAVGQKLPQVDEYIAAAPEFARPILRHLRAAVHTAVPRTAEAMKWSRPFFLLDGVILGNMAAFQRHCSFGLWGEAAAAELRASGRGRADAMGSLGRLTAVTDLPPGPELLRIIAQVAAPILSGERTRSLPVRVARAPLAIPGELQAALNALAGGHDRFSALSPSGRREYCEWVAGAKREATRTARAATAVAWIAEGKSRNWKYEGRAKAALQTDDAADA